MGKTLLTNSCHFCKELTCYLHQGICLKCKEKYGNFAKQADLEGSERLLAEENAKNIEIDLNSENTQSEKNQ